MGRKKLLNGFYNYTVVLTYLGFLLDLFGIACAIKGDLSLAMIMLMSAGICDMFDGAVAATRERTQEEKNFGIQIDSLSDMVCFGVLPAVFVYVMSNGCVLAAVCGGLYALCALIRLAYFNVTEEQRQETETGARKYYTGLPVTSAAVIWPLAFLVGELVGGAVMEWALPALAAVMAVAFVLGFKLKKPHLVGKLVMIAIGVAELVLVILCCTKR